MNPSRKFHEDYAFDELLPRYVRERSERYWTPVEVAERAATVFRQRGAKRILDVGSGPGKFCLVAGSLEPKLEVFGIEQRARLVRIGRRLGRRLGVRNVQLSVGNAIEASWDSYDGLYFFNPFAENIYEEDERFDSNADHSTLRFCSELLGVEQLLKRARIGTVVVTYHGLGGPIPSSYELVSEEHAGSDRVRTWVQGRERGSHWAWLETVSGLLRVSRNDSHWALAALICQEFTDMDDLSVVPSSDHASDPSELGIQHPPLAR